MSRPVTGEYAPNFEGYISLVKEENITAVIKEHSAALSTFYNALPENKADYAYSSGKWTIKEVLQHVIDAERVFSYRLLRIARNDKTPLPGFDENAFAGNASVADRTLQSLKEEFNAVRTSTEYLLKSLGETQLQYKGTSSGYPTTAGAFSYIVYGHLLHHKQILEERYL
jgi:uncharacterized damage-inducible protein DinB